MASNEVIAMVTAIVGAATGIFGASRAWLNDRRARLLQSRWEAVKVSASTWRIESKLLRTAYDVQMDFDLPGWGLGEIDGRMDVVAPGDSFAVTAGVSMDWETLMIPITWSYRKRGGKRHLRRLHLFPG